MIKRIVTKNNRRVQEWHVCSEECQSRGIVFNVPYEPLLNFDRVMEEINSAKPEGEEPESDEEASQAEQESDQEAEAPLSALSDAEIEKKIDALKSAYEIT